MRTNEVNSFKKILLMSVMVPMLLSLSLFAAVPVKIMPLGDSITHEDYRDPILQSTIPEANRTAYRDDLWYGLQGAGYNVSFEGDQSSGSTFMPDSDHQGIGGLTDSEMAANVYGYLTTNPSNIVLLHIGTNGVITDNGADDVETTLNEIDRYETTSGNHVKVILAKIINCRPDWVHPDPAKDNICTQPTAEGTTSDSITAFNNAVVAMAETRIANGDDIVIVDMETGANIIYDATDMIDDLHPDVTGYAKMANVWYDALVDNIPTHQWKLEEAANPYIDTYRDANGICGSLSGVCPTQNSGIIGNAQSFNGADASIDVADDGTFDWAAGDSFTVEFWIKPNNTTGLEVVTGRHKGTTGTASWWIGRDGNKIKFTLDSAETTSNMDLTIDQWTHVTLIRDAVNNETRLYINGQKDNNSVTGTTPNNFNGEKPLNIGWFVNGFYLNSTLDEMTIYNGVLSADQIKQHYDAATGGITLAITSTPVTSAEVNTPYSYTVQSNDPSATYSVTDNQGWMEIIDPAVGEITNAVTLSTVGNTDVTATATNSGQTVNQNFTVKVRDTASLPTGIEHYWKLNETSGATTYIDEYNGATDATCTVGCPTQALGKVDEAQDFNGVNPDLDVPSDASFDWAAGDSFTIEFWMKANTLNPTSVLLGRFSGGNVAWWMGIKDGNAHMLFRDSARIAVEIAGSVVTTGTWYHIAAVRNAGVDFKFYVNGAESSGADTTTGNFNGTVPITIGYFIDSITSSDFNFDGVLDEIAIFNTALSANEIDAHYKNGLAGNGFDNLDVTAPVITLTGANPQEILIGEAYTELGATADDTVDGDVSVDIVIDASAVNTSVLGSYSVSYEVNDTAGNTGSATRTVNVTTGNDPVITLSGDNPYTVEVHSTYVDPGATATDIEDGTVAVSNDSATSINTANLGDQTVTYTATDSDGNTVQTTRTVKVVDTTAPVIALTGATPINLLLNDTYTEQGASCTDNYDATCSVTIGGDTVDTSAVGNYVVSYDATDASGNTATTLTRTVNVTTGNSPVITLNGVNPYTVEVHSTYVDPGATATDIEDGTVIVTNDSVTSIDTANLGDQTVTYTVTDSHGNTVQTTRTVKVLDTTAPVIILTGSPVINLLINDTYTEQGANCTDNYDVICSVTIGGDTVDTSAVGNYTVTYNVTDTSGNTATTLTRTVNVTVGNAPEITLIGNNPYIIEVHSTYVDPGATATDIEDGTVIVTNDSATSIDTANLGDQTVTYTATDSHGNTAQATRTVKVVDTSAPVITLTGEPTINLLLNDTYTEQGASCSDNYDVTCNVTIGGDTVDTSTVGNYTVTYDTTDASGNTATQVTRTVNVLAGNPPVITLNGDNPYTVEVHSTYVDPGATATDIEDGTVTVTNDSLTSVDTSIVGIYTVTYTATDSHGNTVQATRTVNVVEEPTDDWYTVSPDGNTYTVGDSSVELDSNLFTITVNTDSILFEEDGADPKVYIKLMNNGEVFTGYTQATVESATVASGFEPGTKVSVDADGIILIETLLTFGLTLGGK